MPQKYSVGSRKQAYLAFSLLAAAAVLCSATALASCARKSAAGSASAAPSPVGAAPAPGPSAAPSAIKPPQAALAAPAPLPKPAVLLAASLRAFGLGSPSAPRMPMDFSIGPLQSSIPAKGDEAAVLAVARAFMDGLAAGKLDPALLLPEAREALALLLEPTAPRSGSAYRLGAILLRGEDASLRLRLPSAALAEKAAVREEGLLSLRKAGDAWYIEALALDPPASGPLAFAPEALERTK